MESHVERGRWAEDLVEGYVRQKGYRIRERNVRTRGGELDIVAERGLTLAFIEVRMRTNSRFGTPIETINYGKRRRVIRAAQEYCIRHRLFARSIRFDVAGVGAKEHGGEIEYIECAFEADLP